MVGGSSKNDSHCGRLRVKSLVMCMNNQDLRTRLDRNDRILARTGFVRLLKGGHQELEACHSIVRACDFDGLVMPVDQHF